MIDIETPRRSANRFTALRTVLAAAALGLVAAPAEAHLLYVSSEKDNKITVLDTVTGQVVEEIATGKRPRGITFSSDYRRLYVCASDSDTVQVYDVEAKKIVENLPSGADPEQFALAPDDRHLVIANENDAVATVVDVATRQVVAQVKVGEEPEGVAVSHDGRFAVVTAETTNMAHWIDLAKGVPTDDIPVDPRPRYARFSLGDDRLWVSSEIGGTVAVIDTATKEIVKKIAFDIRGVAKDKIQPVGLRLTRDGRYAFVALGPANHVAVVDAKTLEVVRYVLVGKRVWHMELTPEEDRLWVTNGVSNDVTEIDVASLTPLRSIRVGRYPWGVAIRPTK